MKPSNLHPGTHLRYVSRKSHPIVSRLGIGIVLTACLALTACELFDPEEPPFIYLDVDLIAGETSESTALAVRYSLYNRSSKTISAMSLDLYLWDADDEQFPGYGRNYVDISFQGSIPASTEIEITSSLDQAVDARPQETISATEFSIHRVVFDDGSSWRDRYGQFKYPYTITSGAAADEETTE